MGIFDQIGDALDGKPQGVPSKITKITPEDIAATQRRRNSPEFQAALRARARLTPGDFAFQPPAPQLRTQAEAPQ